MSNLGVKEMLALLDTLKGTVRDFAAREEKLNGEFHAQSATAARLSDEAVVKRTEKLADAVERETAEHEERKRQQQIAFDNRKERINQAHAAVRKRVMDEIGEQHGQLKYRIQASTLEAERLRDDALAGTVVTLENFRQATARGGEVLDALTKSTRKAFGGCGKFRRLLSSKPTGLEPGLSADESKSFEEFQRLQKKVGDEVDEFKKFPLPKIFIFAPIWLVTILLLAAGVAAFVLPRFHVNIISRPEAGIALFALAVVWAVYIWGICGATPLAKTIAANLAKARRALDTGAEKAELRYQQDQERIRTEFESTVRDLNQEWRHAVRGTMELRGAKPMGADEQAQRAYQKCERLHRARLNQIETDHVANLARLRGESEMDARKFSELFSAKKAKLEADFQAQWLALEAEWKNSVQPLCDQSRAANAGAEKLFPNGSRSNGKTGRRHANSKTRRNSRASKWISRRWPERCRKTNVWRLPGQALIFPCRWRWLIRSKARSFLKRQGRRRRGGGGHQQYHFPAPVHHAAGQVEFHHF